MNWADIDVARWDEEVCYDVDILPHTHVVGDFATRGPGRDQRLETTTAAHAPPNVP